MWIVTTTERLLLRRFTESDVDALVELDSDPAVMRLLTGGKPTPRAVIERETLPAILREYHRTPGFGCWALTDRASGSFHGWCELRQPAHGDDGAAELGYRLRQGSWGHGYATEASRALLRLAFTELGVHRVFAETMAVNTASRRVMERLGLRHVRTFHLDWDDPIEGTEHGEVEYDLRREDWAAMLGTAQHRP